VQGQLCVFWCVLCSELIEKSRRRRRHCTCSFTQFVTIIGHVGNLTLRWRKIDRVRSSQFELIQLKGIRPV